MRRAYYSVGVCDFLVEDESRILGILTQNHGFALEELQRNAWMAQIVILKEQFRELEDEHFCLNSLFLEWGRGLIMY